MQRKMTPYDRYVRHRDGIWQTTHRSDNNTRILSQDGAYHPYVYRIEHRFGRFDGATFKTRVAHGDLTFLTEMEVIALAAQDKV